MADTNRSSNLSLLEQPDRADEFAASPLEQARTMLDMLRVGRSGGLAIAQCDDFGLRSQLFAHFKHRLAEYDVYLFPYRVTDRDLNLGRTLYDLSLHRFKRLESTVRFKSIVIFVYGIESYSEVQNSQFLNGLNSLQDSLRAIEQPVVIWGTSEFCAQLARSTPDLWDSKEMLFSFPYTALERVEREETNTPPKGPRHRFPFLTRYLQMVVKDPEYAIWQDLYLPLKATRVTDTTRLVPPRHTLTDSEMAQLQQAIVDTDTRAAGEIIFERGAPGETCYIIVAGEVEVLVPDALGSQVVVSTLGPGDFFGEIALLESVPRTATVRTTQPSHLLVLDRRSLGTVSQVAPSVAEMLMQISRRRLETRMRDPQELVSPLRRFALEGHSLIRQRPVDVRQLVSNDQYAMVLGEAGAGKTTVLRRIMLDLANEGLHSLAEPEGTGVVPFFIRLNMLTPDRQVEDLILESLRNYGLPDFEASEDLEVLLKEQGPENYPAGSFVFLMDGLDAMDNQSAVRQDLNRFIQDYSHHRFVMGCRVENYVPVARFRPVMLQRLTGYDIEDFLTRYIGPDQGQRIAREIYGDTQLEDLAQTPLALYMFAQIFKNGEAALPKNRGILFERFTNNLLERADTEWWKIYGRSKSRVPLTVRRAVLASLGLRMQGNEVWSLPSSRWMATVTNELDLFREKASPEEREATRTVSPHDVIEEIMYSGLLRYSGGREWLEFAHHSLQEFFAALALRGQKIDLELLVQGAENRHQWSGTIVLLYGISNSKTPLFFKILGNGNDYSRIWLDAACLSSAGEHIAYVAEDLETALSSGDILDEQQRFGALFSVGLAYRQLERYPEALTYLHRAADSQPDSAEVQYELGSLYRLVDQHDRAIKHLEEAIRIRPDFVDAYNQLGITYYDQGKHAEALTIFRATAQLEPSNPLHYHNLGSVLKLLRNYPAARDAFQTAIELKADYIEALTQLDILEKALASGVIQVLDRIPLLSRLTLEQNMLLANRLKVIEYKPGQIVFHMGEMGDTFYIIETGEVEVLAPDVKGSPNVLDRLGPGDFFGEIALLRAVPRTATIRVVAPVRLLALSRADFNDVLTRYPSLAHRLEESSGERLLRDRHRGRTTSLDRYYDPAYIEELVQQKEVTVVMGDIHGSTFLTHAIGPELMVEFLDEYLKRMSAIIVQAGGAMDRSLGDSVMGVFGSFHQRYGDRETSSGTRALLAALHMRQDFSNLRAKWSEQNPEFAQTGMGVGLSTGSVAKGTIGSETAMVGSAVNLANKLSKLAIKGRQESEIYADERTCQMLGDSVIAELLDPVYTSRKAGGVLLRAYRIIQRRG